MHGTSLTAAWVEPGRLRSLVEGIPESAYSKYPSLSRGAVRDAVVDFLAGER
jgi:hypothetical protein